MRRRGFHPATIERYRFRFNIAVAIYGDAVDRRKNETVQKNAPKDKSKTPKISVPKYTSLTGLLNLPKPDEVAMADPKAQAEHDALIEAWQTDPEEFVRMLQEKIGLEA